MFSQKIIELAQATSTTITENLQNTESQLQNLNVKLDLVKEEYNAAVNQPNTYSFFNLDNIYFWFVLAGLLLLAFGLLFLLAELQNKGSKAKVKSIKPAENEMEDDVLEKKSDKELEKVFEQKHTKKSWFKPSKKAKKLEPKIEIEEPEVEVKKEVKKTAPVKTAKKSSGVIKVKVEKIK